MTKIHVFDLLPGKEASAETPSEANVCVLFGQEPFLRQLARRHLLDRWTAEGDADVSTFEEGARWRDVRDELATLSLFGGGRRLVLVRDADDFVTEHRGELEQYVAEPSRSGTLILEVGSFPANTRLYKAVQKSELSVDCRPPEVARGRGKPVPDTARIARWLRSRGESVHQCQLQPAAADLLLELVGLNFGLLDQELAKLALFVEPGQAASPQLVRQVCGGWRTQTTWDMIDAAVSGQAAAALQQLDQLLRAGEAPQAVFAQVSWSLRRFAAATRIYALGARRGDRISLRDALQAAGILSFRLKQAEQQLRQIGQARAARLLSWLMEADLALKGSHSSPPRARFALEQLVIKLAAEAA